MAATDHTAATITNAMAITSCTEDITALTLSGTIHVAAIQAHMNPFEPTIEKVISNMITQAQAGMGKLMNSPISATKDSKESAATDTNNVLWALEKVEQRKKKLELEIKSSEDKIAIAKKRKLVAKLDKRQMSCLSLCEVKDKKFW